MEQYLDKPFSALERGNLAMALRDPEPRGLSGAEREIKLLIKGLMVARDNQRAAVISVALAQSPPETVATTNPIEQSTSPAQTFESVADSVADNAVFKAEIVAEGSIPPAPLAEIVAAEVTPIGPTPPTKRQKRHLALARLGATIRDRGNGLY